MDMNSEERTADARDSAWGDCARNVFYLNCARTLLNPGKNARN